jgi:hypothetical protein
MREKRVSRKSQGNIGIAAFSTAGIADIPLSGTSQLIGGFG